jgi:hypothetical protein
LNIKHIFKQRPLIELFARFRTNRQKQQQWAKANFRLPSELAVFTMNRVDGEFLAQGKYYLCRMM